MNIRSLCVGILAAILFLFVAVTVSNLPLLWALGMNGALSVSLVLSMFGALFTNMTLLLAMVTVVNALLFGAIVAMTVRRQTRLPSTRKQKGVLFGTLLALFGSGCASCGALLFGSALPFVGGGALLALLPLEGGEFAILGTVLLVVALWRLYRATKVIPLCAIDAATDKA